MEKRKILRFDAPPIFRPVRTRGNRHFPNTTLSEEIEVFAVSRASPRAARRRAGKGPHDAGGRRCAALPPFTGSWLVDRVVVGLGDLHAPFPFTRFAKRTPPLQRRSVKTRVF